jgi:hypothetical protein
MPRFFKFINTQGELISIETIHEAVVSVVRTERGFVVDDNVYTTLIDYMAIAHGGRTASAVISDLCASASVYDSQTARILKHLVSTCDLHAFASGCC